MTSLQRRTYRIVVLISSAGMSPARLDMSQLRWIDLTLSLERGLGGFEWDTKFTVARDGWNARTLHVYSHCGTRMDSQFHFEAGPESIDQIPLVRCCGPARVASLPHTQLGELLTVAHLGPLAHSFSRGEILLLETNWSRHLPDSALYRDRLPHIGEDLAHCYVARGVKLLGVEPPSVADVNNREEVTRNHHILLDGGVTIVEGLINLDQLPATGSWFIATPLKITAADGSPCRAAALVPNFGSQFLKAARRGVLQCRRLPKAICRQGRRSRPSSSRRMCSLTDCVSLLPPSQSRDQAGSLSGIHTRRDRTLVIRASVDAGRSGAGYAVAGCERS